MIHTKKEFAALAKMASNRLAIYISRGKVILLGDGKISDEDPRNRDFILKHSAKEDKVVETAEVIEKVERKPRFNKIYEKKEADSQQKTVNSVPNSSLNLDKYTLELEKLEKTNQKLDVDIRLSELKEEKIRGEVIPIVLVSNIFKAHTQSIVTSQKDFIENMLVNITKEHRLSGEQLAKLRGKMVDGLNVAVDKAITSSKRNLKSLVEEFSIAKTVGEND